MLSAIAIASLGQKHRSEQQLYLKPTHLSLRRWDSDFLDLDIQSVLRFSCLVIKHTEIAEEWPLAKNSLATKAG